MQIALFDGDGHLTSAREPGLPGSTGVFAPGGGPGTYFVKCYPGDSSVDPATIDAAAAVTVVDPNGYWVSTELGCPKSQRAAYAFSGFLGPTPEEALHSPGGIPASDTVEPAGYTGDPANETWRVVRGGEVIAWVDVVPDLGAWESTAGHFCKGTI